jgi:hypothetical protein
MIDIINISVVIFMVLEKSLFVLFILKIDFGWDRKNRGPVSQQVWHDKNPFLLKDPDRRA